MNRFLLLVILLLTFPLHAGAESWVVDLEDWSHPRSGQMVSEITAVRQAVEAWEANQGRIIRISYPVGESGSLWAEELSDWLISLGIPPASIELTPVSASRDNIEMAISGLGEQ